MNRPQFHQTDEQGETKLRQVPTQNTVALSASKPGNVDAQQQRTKSEAVKLLGILGIGIAIGGTGVGLIMHDRQTSRDQETNTGSAPAPGAAPSSETSGGYEAPTQIPRTAEELKMELKKYGIKAAAENFSQEGRNMKAIMLVEEKGSPDQPAGTAKYHWEPVDSKKFDQGTLIATKIEKPEYNGWISYIGIEPVASATDEQDSTIRYYLYLCSTNKNPLARGAAIVMRAPTSSYKYRRKGFYATLDMNIPLCIEEKTE